MKNRTRELEFARARAKERDKTLVSKLHIFFPRLHYSDNGAESKTAGLIAFASAEE